MANSRPPIGPTFRKTPARNTMHADRTIKSARYLIQIISHLSILLFLSFLFSTMLSGTKQIPNTKTKIFF